MNAENVTSFDSFGNKSIRFINFMLKDKSLLEYANLSFPNEYVKNDKIILKYFQ